MNVPAKILLNQAVTGRGLTLYTGIPTDNYTFYFVFPATVTALTIDIEGCISLGVGQATLPFQIFQYVVSAIDLAAGSSFLSLNSSVPLPTGQSIPLVTQLSLNIISITGIGGVDGYVVYK